MGSVIKSKSLPEKSIILKSVETIDYFDSFKINKATSDTIDKIVVEIFNSPAWVESLMSIRNSMVKIFGLKTGKQTEPEKDFYPIGSKLKYFRVIDRNENEIVFGEKDKHLNFISSILIDRTASEIYLNTLVHFNNIGGRLYFLPVKPFHKIIIKSLLKKLLKTS